MKTSTLSHKFLRRVLILLLLGQMISLTWVCLDRKKTEEGKLNRNTKLLAEMVAKSAARSLLDNYDFTYLSILIDEILNDNDILSVEFRDHQGKEFFFSRSERKPLTSASAEVPISTRMDEVGNVRISYTYDNIRKDLLVHVLLLLVVQGAVFLALIMLIRYFFRADLGEKINQVGKVIAEVKTGDLVTRIDYKYADEIGIIAKGFDFLVEHLAATIIKMRSISQKLSRAADHVDSTTKHMVQLTGEQQSATDAIFRSVNEASRSQQLIVENTAGLLALSQENGTALDGIRTTFAGVVTNVDTLDGSSATLYSSIAEMTGSAKAVFSLADHAAQSVREASVTMAAINRSVAEIDTVVKESTALSVGVTEVLSGKGITSIAETNETMERIESFFELLSETIARLDVRSKDIAKILTVIQSVTEQAHLLSLNARIIAAQAGENGKSFEVVANEMNVLSTKTAESAGEIEGIVSTIQKEIRSAVGASSETSSRIRQGRVAVNGTGEVLREILDASRHSTEMMKRITVATGEQNRLLETAMKDINMLRDLNERVKAATEEQEKSAALLLGGIGFIRDSMVETKMATEAQAHALNTIAANIDEANTQTEEIAGASLEQQKVNKAIIESMDVVSRMGVDLIESVQGVAASISGVNEKLDLLEKEMKFFRTDRAESGI